MQASTPSVQPCDLLIVGGGINGAGIANAAAQRGLSVLLVEQDDLASATSSRSSKMIHGGLRYLEHNEFRLVREALTEREILLDMAPHLIHPLRFVLPHHAALRPAWLIRAGLFLYDHLGGRQKLPASRQIRLTGSIQGQALREQFVRGFEYSDCRVDDARLVVANAIQAQDFGASILTRTRVERARRDGALWQVDLHDGGNGQTRQVTARAMVNAAGPWVADMLGQRAGIASPQRVRLVKGSHIVIPRLHEGDHAYILQNHDHRVVFVIPYEEAFSLIGTTDIPYSGDPAEVEINADETAYLCRVVSEYFHRQVVPADVVWAYSGVRPLFDDQSDNPSAVTRDYVLSLDAPPGCAPLLSIFGGKITTYRRLADQALRDLAPFFTYLAQPARPHALPGGDIGEFSPFLTGMQRRYPWLPPRHLERMARRHGGLLQDVIGGASSLGQMGRHFGAGLYEREVAYLCQHEWARTADDLLWRRTKAGLHLTPAQSEAFRQWLQTAELGHKNGN